MAENNPESEHISGEKQSGLWHHLNRIKAWTRRKTEPSREVTVSKPETVEYPLPFLKIPNGYPEDDQERMRLGADKEPNEEELKKFFTPEVIQRLIYCPAINRDLLDDWNMFGKGPGYLYVAGRRYKGEKTLSDMGMLRAVTTDKIKTASGVELLTVPDYDLFPREKFIAQEITAERTPRTFMYLRKVLENVNPDDYSTYPVDDLFHNLKRAREKLEPDGMLLSTADMNRRAASHAMERGDTKHVDDYMEMAEKAEKIYKDQKELVPQHMQTYLELVHEFQRREGITNPAALRYLGSFDEQEQAIQDTMEQARKSGNQELAEKIGKLREETVEYRRDSMYLPSSPPDEQKLLSGEESD